MAEHKEIILITSQRKHSEYLRDTLKFIDLLYFFTWRDILVRYRQAFFGVAWALMRPILNMAIFVVIFGKIAHLPSKDINYSLFVLAGMLPWQLFSNGAIETSGGIVNNAYLVSRAFFPRIIIPLSQICVLMLDFLITAALVCLAILIFEGFHATMLLFPVAVLLTLSLTIGISLWLSALTVLYRDFRIIVPFFIQFGMFASPVGYGSFIIPEQWQWAFALNPMVGVIDFYRYVFFGQTYSGLEFSIWISTLASLFLLWTGFFFFRNMERSLIERI